MRLENAPGGATRRSSPRRILFVAHVSICGGAERSLLDLIEGLHRERFTPHVVLPAQGELSKRFDAVGARVHRCSDLRRLHRSGSVMQRLGDARALVRGALRLRGLVQRLGPDLVHANSTTAALYSIGAVVHRGPPLIWHLRDITRLDGIGRLMARCSARIVVPSRACFETVEAFADPKKVAFIPNGVATLAPRASARLRNEIAPGQGPLGAVIGQLAPWKGHTMAIDAMRRVHECNPRVRLVLVGDDRFGDAPGSSARLQRRIHECGLGGCVRLLGHRSDVDAILASVDFLVHPAFPEPFGRVVVEAMVAACPVIAFAGHHGPAEILRSGIGGVLVAERSPAALAEAILFLASQPELRGRMGSEGQRRARLLYDRERMARRMEALYESILTGSPSGRGGAT